MRAAAEVVQDAEVAIDADAAKLLPVERVISAKIEFDDEGEPTVMYLAKWKVCLSVQRCSYQVYAPAVYLRIHSVPNTPDTLISCFLLVYVLFEVET